MSGSPATPPAAASPHRAAYRAPLEMIDQMIKSGDFDILFTALKGFRNGVVYGTRVRAPHALVLNLVWSKAPYSTMPRKIFNVTRTHAVGLGLSSVIFALVRGILKVLQGREEVWHTALGAFMMGFICWGDPNNGVHIQMMMYMLSRVVCAGYHLLMKKYPAKVPSISFRVYMGILYALCMTLVTLHPDTLQSSMRQSLEYIFLDSGKFTNWYDVFIMNTANSL